MDLTNNMLTAKETEVSELEIEQITYFMYVTAEVGNMGNIFKKFTPSTEIPFASWNNIHKSIKGTVIEGINDEWIYKDKDLIVLQIKRNTTKNDQYVECQFVYDETVSRFCIVFNLEVGKIGDKDGNRLKRDIMGCFGDIEFDRLEESDVNGIFNAKIANIQGFIFLDMITNDPVVSKYLSVDEIEKTKKEWNAFKYHKDGRDDRPATLTFTLTNSTDRRYVGWQRVKIRGQHTTENIAEFTKTFSRILTRYTSEAPAIIKIYSDCGITESDEVTKIDIVNDPGEEFKNTRGGCPSKRKPVGYLMRKNAEKAIKHTGDDKIIELENGDKMRYWICKDEKTPFPGLVKGTGSAGAPVPCCFGKVQVGNKNSELYQWKTGNFTDGTRTNSNASYVLGGNKSLGDGSVGDIPSTIFFLKKYTQRDWKRLGVSTAKNSILKCLDKATGKQSPTPTYFELAKQEMFNMCTEDIKKIYEEGIVDYRDFASLLEETYNVNIAVFNEDGIVTPNYKNGYFKRPNKFPFVILFEQSGPTYELVYDASTFMFGDPYVAEEIAIRRPVTRVNKKNVISNGIKKPDDWNIIGQAFDTFGKTRYLRLQVDSNRLGGVVDPDYVIDIQISPIQPIATPEIQIPRIRKYATEELDNIRSIASQMLTSSRMAKVSETISASEIVFTNGEQEITVPYEGSENNPNPTVATSTESALLSHIKNKRMARYLIENVVWSFAQFIRTREKGRGVEITTREALESALVDFIAVSKMLKVEQKVSLGKINCKFANKGGIYNEEGQIVVPDNQMLKKLLFTLRHFILRTPGKIEQYKEMKFIPDFYLNSTDFIGRYSDTSITCSSFNVFRGSKIILDK
jgi:hypothetical protein